MLKQPYVILKDYDKKYYVNAVFWSAQTNNIMAVNINFTGTLFLHVNEDNTVINSKGNIKGKIYYD